MRGAGPHGHRLQCTHSTYALSPTHRGRRQAHVRRVGHARGGTQGACLYATPTLPACYSTELAEALLDQVIDEQQTVSRAAECISPPPQESSPAYEGLRVNTTARARKQRGHGPDIEDKRATSADTHEQAAQHDTTLRSPPGRQHAPPAHDNRSSCATGLNTPVASRPPATLAPSRISPRAAPATEQLDRARPRSEPRRAPIFTRLGELCQHYGTPLKKS